MTPMSLNRRSEGRLLCRAVALSLGTLCLTPLLSTSPAIAVQSAAPDAGTLMQQAASLATAGKWQQAAQTYNAASKAYAANGQSAEQATALEKSAEMYEKYANSLSSGLAAKAAATPQTAQQNPVAAATMTAMAPGAAPLPIANSAIVHHGAAGALSVAGANGAPIDGVKISKHDKNIQSPSIVVAPNGTIHVAFLEQEARGIQCSIYHRASSDGGKTWTEAKNLSEIMPDLNVGMCKVAADGAGRVYVVWNVGSGQYNPAGISPHAGGGFNNLVYRVLSGGQWNGKAIPIHQMATNSNQSIGSDSYFVSTDPAGNVHVVWNEIPDRLHPEVMFSTSQHSSGVGDGLVMEATLNGTTPTAPKQIYMTPVTPGQLGPVMDGLDMLNGYVDAADQAHFVSLVAPARGGEGNHFQLIENGGQTPAVELPGSTFEYWDYPPTLLTDSQGHKHIVTLYEHGEQPNVRDYTIGSDSEPKTIRSVKGTAGKVLGFQAFQGPSGRMVAIMRENDTGSKTDDELYVSTSDGGAWTTPINITNNSGRLKFHSTNTSSRSNVATMSWGFPGAATGTFDKSGHLLLLYVRNKMEIFGSNALGVELAGGSTATPNLMFLRF